MIPHRHVHPPPWSSIVSPNISDSCDYVQSETNDGKKGWYRVSGTFTETTWTVSARQKIRNEHAMEWLRDIRLYDDEITLYIRLSWVSRQNSSFPHVRFLEFFELRYLSRVNTAWTLSQAYRTPEFFTFFVLSSEYLCILICVREFRLFPQYLMERISRVNPFFSKQIHLILLLDLESEQYTKRSPQDHQ